MTRVLVVVLLGVSSGAFAQSPDIDTPLLAAPANQRAAATVIKWKADFTYDTLRKGTNRQPEFRFCASGIYVKGTETPF